MAWLSLTMDLNYATRGGQVTALGLHVAHELARAAVIDGGLRDGSSRSDRIATIDDPMPDNDSIPECCGFTLRVPPHGDPVVFAPAALDGWARVVGDRNAYS